MGKHKRKVQLKKLGSYVNPKETWNLDQNITKYILPRLIMFKKLTNGYPCRDEIDSPESWDKALDKMILAFKYIIEKDDWWIGDPQYDYTGGLNYVIDRRDEDGRVHGHFTELSEEYEKIKEAHIREENRRYEAISEGLSLFAKYYLDLWW